MDKGTEGPIEVGLEVGTGRYVKMRKDKGREIVKSGCQNVCSSPSHIWIVLEKLLITNDRCVCLGITHNPPVHLPLPVAHTQTSPLIPALFPFINCANTPL